jgi:hypothetical protein
MSFYSDKELLSYMGRKPEEEPRESAQLSKIEQETEHPPSQLKDEFQCIARCLKARKEKQKEEVI